MSITAFKTFSAGEVLTASDLNSSFAQIVTNGTDVAFPLTKNGAAGGFVLTGLGAGTAAGHSVRYEQITDFVPLGMCEGRLTLTTAVPVTTGDVTAAETLYFTPYRGNRIALYDGVSAWAKFTFSELSIDVPDVTGMHDVFAYNNSGTVALEVLVWTNDTTRATALVLQDGVLVKTGVTTRRYLGSFYSTTAGNGQIEDSTANRYLWNYYNRIRRVMRCTPETTNAWNYTTATVRQANANTSNQLNFCVGYNEDIVTSEAMAFAASSGSTARFLVGVGLDSVTVIHASNLGVGIGSGAANKRVALFASLKVAPGVGKHYLAWLEYSEATDTTSWFGDDTANLSGLVQSGIHGEIFG